MSARKTTEEFIVQANAVHGMGTYDYSKVVYQNNETKVIIMCSKHGAFEQRPSSHLSGHGCAKCARCECVSKLTKTTEEFISKSIVVHGDDQYDYSKVDYRGNRYKVIITCRVHGDFEQTPNSHLSGSGCGICYGNFKSTTKEFIAKSNAVHGENKYDYSKTNYKNNAEKVTITCKIHGDFEQTPSGHLSGHGCAKCGGTFKSTTEEFIAKSNAVHGSGKYGYQKVDYRGSNHKVTITCKVHGDFEQTPNTHLKGQGCGKCGGGFKSTTEEFIAKSNAVHGRGKYGYKKVDYRGNLSKVTITCKIHGDFEQTPSGHLSGHGCAKCSGNSRMTKEEFISKAVIVHGDDQYDYSKVDYRGNRYKVIITCKTHGDFEQKPNSHLNGQRCGKCHSSKCEQVIRNWLKKRNYPYKQQVRFASCRNKNPLPFDFSVDGGGDPTVMLIEFHGTQHYEPHSFRHSSKDTPEQMEANLAKLQHNDAIKAKWCEDNNVPLLVIPYWDQHRIPELLEEFLGSASLVGAV